MVVDQLVTGECYVAFPLWGDTCNGHVVVIQFTFYYQTWRCSLDVAIEVNVYWVTETDIHVYIYTFCYN